jgi:hypothetical protein
VLPVDRSRRNPNKNRRVLVVFSRRSKYSRRAAFQ